MGNQNLELLEYFFSNLYGLQPITVYCIYTENMFTYISLLQTFFLHFQKYYHFSNDTT
jgi:hypothetical protein